MVQKYFLFCLVFCIGNNLFSKHKDSVFFNHIEVNTFRAFTNRDYYQQSDQIGNCIKLNMVVYKHKSIMLSINPIFIRFKSQFFRGAFFDSIKISSDMEIGLKSNFWGCSGGFEYLIGEKLSLKTELGFGYNNLNFESVSDNFIDSNKYTYCPPSVYLIQNDIAKMKFTFFSKLIVNAKLSKRIGLNIGLHFQQPLYKINNTTLYEKCYSTQVQKFYFVTNVTHFSFGLNYYFNLPKKINL